MVMHRSGQIHGGSVLSNDIHMLCSPVDGARNGTLVDNGDSTYTYTPATAFTGTDTFTYTITDADTASPMPVIVT